MMSFLVVMVSMGTARSAEGEACTPAATTMDLQRALDEGHAAVDARNAKALAAQVERATRQLGCLADPPTSQQLALYHGLRGIAAYQAGQQAAASDAFKAARVLIPDLELAAIISPPPVGLRRLWDGVEGPVAATPSKGGNPDVLWNGQAGASRPSGGPALYQRREGACVVVSRLVEADAPPPEAERAAWSTLRQVDLNAVLDQAKAAARGKRADELRREVRRAEVLLPCASERVQPDWMADYYLLRGVDSYQAQGAEAAREWFSAARGVAPELALSALVDQPSSKMQAAWDEAAGKGAPGPALKPLADGASRVWDGRSLSGRPQEVPTLYQRLDRRGAIELTLPLGVNDPIPVEALKVQEVATVLPPDDDDKPGRRERLGWSSLALGMASAGVAVWQGVESGYASNDADARSADGVVVPGDSFSKLLSEQEDRNVEIDDLERQQRAHLAACGAAGTLATVGIVLGATWAF